MNHTQSAAHERYKFKPFTGSSHYWALNILRESDKSSFVLDFGAGSGAIGKELGLDDFVNLYAVEVDPESRQHIGKYYKETSDNILSFSDKKFDFILLLDVLEHIVNPELILENLAGILKPSGIILISLPNIAHWSVRFPLFFGYFNYKDRGILDRTHINFYTYKNARKFLNSIKGIEVTGSDASIEPVEFLLPEFVYNNILFKLCSSIRHKIALIFPGLLAYQSLFLVRKKH